MNKYLEKIAGPVAQEVRQGYQKWLGHSNKSVRDFAASELQGLKTSKFGEKKNLLSAIKNKNL